MLHTCRCPDFKEDESIELAARRRAERSRGLVVIGGDGSFRAARTLGKVSDVAMVGVPATIDNDVYGTEETIGFDTAVNTNIATIDRIRDTATALDRIFIVGSWGGPGVSSPLWSASPTAPR